ncbi:FadR/GntR family transcriptional regulator [Variovorax saccharolyticus]|uniref:FadR/GntR family transcriptional regulator n=1 Tax=Variovorax saccharolyticus TaxID=3053516 RepID=UPI002577467B|nr:FadR/GntR family transcriptional regulator [Variovorax sp. J31P216]MDM0024359.1 FadR/GntR family transcriptional regulator [Variovorax sp. J31P216]
MNLKLIPGNAQAEGASKVAERSYLRLAAQIMELVQQGEIKPGERLPAERVLAERFDVSRTAVREATISLEIQGVVEVRGGSGVYVTQTPTPIRSVVVTPFMPASEPGPFELLRARCLIEAEIAGQAAQVRKDSDLDRIFSALTEMHEQMDNKEANAEADRLFHVRIAESTGNSVLMQMVTALWAQARGPIWTKIEHHFHTPELRLASHADHQRIFNALLARDADASRAAMRAHIERVITEFTQAWR